MLFIPTIRFIKTRCKFWLSDSMVDEFFSQKDIFFMLSVGRSGTRFLSNLLNSRDNAIVFHEPVPEDERVNPICLRKPDLSKGYIRLFRKKLIYERLRKESFRVYGEINPRLRYMYDGLASEFSAKFFFLVRDGREIIRSIMARSHYKDKNHSSFKFYPCKGEPYSEEWASMDRFERICWFWMHGNKYLRKKIGEEPIKFERLLSDYSYFCDKLLNKINIEITEESWRTAVEAPTNVTEKHVLPIWPNWPDKLRLKFDKICGEEMKKLGYY